MVRILAISCLCRARISTGTINRVKAGVFQSHTPCSSILIHLVIMLILFPLLWSCLLTNPCPISQEFWCTIVAFNLMQTYKSTGSKLGFTSLHTLLLNIINSLCYYGDFYFFVLCWQNPCAMSQEYKCNIISFSFNTSSPSFFLPDVWFKFLKVFIFQPKDLGLRLCYCKAFIFCFNGILTPTSEFFFQFSHLKQSLKWNMCCPYGPLHWAQGVLNQCTCKYI